MPGHAEDCATLHLGYGRTAAGRVGNGVGTNAYPLRTTQAPWIGPSPRSRGTGERYTLSSTQMHSNIELEGEEAEKRHLVRTATLAELRPRPGPDPRDGPRAGPAMTLYPNFEYKGYAWGMAIDLNACTGCNACVVACQAENNIPTVGKEQVRRGREMHWIRVDRYYGGELDAPLTLHQPVALHAVRERALRDGLPGGGDRALVRRPERHGLQPLRRHALLLEQLPLQGAALQLPALQRQRLQRRAVEPGARAAAQPRRHGAQPRRDGEVHLLRAAHQRDEDRGRGRRPQGRATARSRPPASRPARRAPSRSATSTTPDAKSSRWKSEPRNYGLLDELNTRPRTTLPGAHPQSEPGAGGAASLKDGNSCQAAIFPQKRRRSSRPGTRPAR